MTKRLSWAFLVGLVLLLGCAGGSGLLPSTATPTHTRTGNATSTATRAPVQRSVAEFPSVTVTATASPNKTCQPHNWTPLPSDTRTPTATPTGGRHVTPTRMFATPWTPTASSTWVPQPVAFQADARGWMWVRASGYAPMWGGVNGGACLGKPWGECFVQAGDAACGYSLARYTVLEVDYPLAEWGLPQQIRCRDRGGPAVQLDLEFIGPDPAESHARALAWGRRWIRVRVVSTPD